MKALALTVILFIMSAFTLTRFDDVPSSVVHDRPSVFNLLSEGVSDCTAFAVKPNNLSNNVILVSAGHCAEELNDGAETQIQDSTTNLVYTVILLHKELSWPKVDYSIWKFKDAVPERVGIVPTNSIPGVGSQVWNYGANLGMTPTLVAGIYSGVSGCVPNLTGACQIANMHIANITSTYGSSGSPMLDKYGRVWGILVGGHPKLPGIAVVVPMPELLRWLQ